MNLAKSHLGSKLNLRKRTKVFLIRETAVMLMLQQTTWAIKGITWKVDYSQKRRVLNQRSLTLEICLKKDIRLVIIHHKIKEEKVKINQTLSTS